MSFIETEASVRYETVNGKKVMIITPKSEVTLTNMKTGQGIYVRRRIRC